jgi:hypothetical protein
LSHVAASGGSFFSAHLAKYTNSILLSEINPFGWVNALKVPHFSLKGYRPGRPLDLALNFTKKDLPRKLKIKHFCQQLQIVFEYAEILNKNVLIRDHTHHTFPFLGQQDKLSTIDLLVDNFVDKTLFGVSCHLVTPVLSIRHPLDSFISSRLRNWHLNYSVDGSFRGYCESLLRRQKIYQQKYNSKILRYEDLCTNEPLFRQQFTSEFNVMSSSEVQSNEVIPPTGRSGRSKDKSLQIRTRQFEYLDEQLINEANEDNAYQLLCEINGYEQDPLSNHILKL